MVACGNEERFQFLLSFLGHMHEMPTEKPSMAVVLTGRQGTGKSIVLELLRTIFGKGSVATVASSATALGHFNSIAAERIAICFEELAWGRRGDKDKVGPLKTLITESRMNVTRKHADTEECDNYARVFITSNERAVVPADAGTRRFAVFSTSASKVGDTAYFEELAAAVRCPAAASRYVLGRAIAAFHTCRGQGESLHRLPRCFERGLWEQQAEALPAVHAFLWDALVAGELAPGTPWPEPGTACDKGQLLEFFRAARGRVAACTTAADLVREIRKVLPGAQSKQTREGATRPYRLFLPGVEEARASFAKFYNQEVGTVFQDG